MRVYLLTYGTRGDVQPFVALGRALREAGHEAVLAGPACLRGPADAHGVPFVPVDDRWNRLTEQPRIREALATNYRGPRAKATAVAVVRRTREYLAAALNEMADGTPPSTDVVVHHSIVPGAHLGEAIGVPAVPVTLQPNWVPTSAFGCPLWTPTWWPHRLNRMSYRPAALAQRALLGPVPRRWRTGRLGLPPRTGPHGPDDTPVLQAFSDHVLPGPPAWPEHAPAVGFWSAPDPGPLEGRLAAFLDDGPPPVVFGFGSMRGRDPSRIGRLVRRTAELTGHRAVVLTGDGGIEIPGENDDPGPVLAVQGAPHDALFARAAAVVHHGGAGTTAAALRAGRPQVVCPFTGDQPFWARRMHACEVAPAPLPQDRITLESLLGAVQVATADPGHAERAAHLGELVRAEDGERRAIRALHAVVGGRAPTSTGH